MYTRSQIRERAGAAKAPRRVSAGRWVAPAAALLLCVGLTSRAEQTPEGGAQQAPSGRLTVVIGEGGFTPAEATVEPGIAHLELENRTGAKRLTVRVSRDGGEHVRDLVVEGPELWTELGVAAGDYTLTEAERGWVFRLKVREPDPPATPTPTPPAPE